MYFSVMNAFFDASLKALEKYHPGWDSWDEEKGEDFEKRKSIMVPPSYDLLKRYVGPDEGASTGYQVGIFKQSRSNIL
jgi:hypothetical protein